GAGVGDRLQGAPLVAHVAGDGVHEVGDQVMPALQLDVDLGPRLLGPVSGRDEAVVGEDQPEDDQNDGAEKDSPANDLPPRTARVPPNGSSSAFSCACACASSCAAS